MDDSQLLNYYISLRNSEAGLWNLSPESLYLELETREFLRKNLQFADRLPDGIQVCNIGIGTGDWDDYLGYLLDGRGVVTSVDIDKDICEMFAYRQRREGHPNPSVVVCENMLNTTLLPGSFDIITMIGSTVREIGDYDNAFQSSFRLLKTGGRLMYMDLKKYHPSDLFRKWVDRAGHVVEIEEHFDRFKKVQFYIFTARKC